MSGNDVEAAAQILCRLPYLDLSQTPRSGSKEMLRSDLTVAASGQQ